MARKAKTRVSYVLPLPNSPGGHRLGVNSLALDRRGILYTAGRDGAICSWNLHTDLSEDRTPHPSDVDRAKPPASTFRAQVQAHTHWVNDIALTADANALVSCSSDLTVKLWRPNSRDAPTNLGLHSDYVKCVVTPSSTAGGTWVASGGLDRKIYLWDIGGGGEQLCIDVGDEGSNPKGSIYALGTGGGILASGGPEAVVRVWDPRTGNPITKFVGHTDLVRSILVSEHGNVILTASSDATVKMWDIRGGRCMHTLTMHNDSVWSLHSDHPSLEMFHSSDRSGLVAKTDIRNVTEIDEGISVAVCHEQEGVNKVIGDGGLGSYIWTATSSSRIHRWLDADTNLELAPRMLPPTENGEPSPDIKSHQHRPSNASTISRSIASNLEGKTPRPTLPIDSLLRLSSINPFAPIPTTRDPDAVTVYSVSHHRQASVNEVIDTLPDSVELKPVYDTPDETIEGQNGLIKHVLLNDRRRVLTLDTAGDVVEWDLVRCSVIKSWGKQHLEDVVPQVNTVDSMANWCQVDTRTGRLAVVLEENYCFDAEMYADEAVVEGSIEFRDDQRINLGKWVLRYLFSNLIDEEIRRDEAYRKAITEAKTFQERTRRPNAPPTISLPAPPNMKAWDEKLTPLTTPKAGMNGYGGSLHTIQTPGLSIGLATPAISNFISNSPRTDDGHLPAMPEEEGGTSTPMEKPDYFSSAPPAAAETPTSPLPGTTPVIPVPATPVEPPTTASKLSFGKLWGKTKGNRNSNVEEKKPEEPVAEVVATPPPVADPLEETLTGVLKTIRRDYIPSATNKPIKTSICPSLPIDTPVLKHPSDMVVIIQEDKPDSGGVKDVYRGTVGDLGIHADELEPVVPAWVAEAILLNRVPTKDVVKVSFILLPYQSGEGRVLPAIANPNDANARLNANRMLRAKKILGYVAERMEPLPEQAGGVDTELGEVKAEDWLELLCKEEIVPLNTTLATLRAHIWKTGGDVILHYRMKDNGIPIKRKPVVPAALSNMVDVDGKLPPGGPPGGPPNGVRHSNEVGRGSEDGKA